MCKVTISWAGVCKNEALIECIEFIGANNTIKCHSNSNFYRGVKFLAKKVKGGSTTNVKNMVYPARRNKKENCYEWKYRSKVYERTYRYIYYTMHRYKKNRPEAAQLLLKLSKEVEQNSAITYSDIVAYQQKDMFEVKENMNPNQQELKCIKSIRNEFDRIDKVYKYMYRR